MSNKHYRPAKEFRKKGMSVTVRTFRDDHDTEENRIKAMDQAIKQLRERLNKEGIIREMSERSYYVSKGEQARKDKAVGIMRHRKMVRDRERQSGY